MDLASIFGFGLSRSQAAKQAFWGSVGVGTAGAALDMGLVGFQSARSGRGSKIPAIVGQSVTVGAGTLLAGFAAVGLSLIPGIGPLAAILIAGTLGGYGEYRFGSSLIKKVRMFSEYHKNIRHLEMGGSYQDSELASRQRFIALQDMNASMIPGRRYLGQEALLMHR